MRYRYSILIPGLIYVIALLALLLLIVIYRDGDENLILVFATSSVLLGLSGIFYFLLGIYYPLTKLKQKLKSLSEAEDFVVEPSRTAIEFTDTESALQNHVKRLKEIIKMANDLAEGKIDEDFKAIGNYDELGKAILKVKESILLSNIEAGRRRTLDEQQNWASQGIARFGELLRDFDQHISTASNKFIHELVKYVDMEVGGFFILHLNEDKELCYKLTGAYAFDREKQSGQIFMPGEGLVGRCAIEKASIIITEVPEDYIRIRSGLGEDNPSTIVLVPVIFNDEVLGVIELATFSEVQKYKIDFLEALGMSVASSLSKSLSVN